MLEELKKETNYTYTENGALTLASSMDNVLDLFGGIGSLRHVEESEIIKRFERAYVENPDLAMRCLFYARDIRKGLGERRTFRAILRWLGLQHIDSVKKNIARIAQFGRYDDLLALMDTPVRKTVLRFIAYQLKLDKAAADSGNYAQISLLAKWLPSINASNGETVAMAKKIAVYLRIDNKSYRKLLSGLRDKIQIIENKLRTKDYSFDYAKQPGKAMLKYREAFLRNDKERYLNFLHMVETGETSLHTGTLTPYDIVAPILDKKEWSQSERQALNTTWNALEDFTGDENALVVVDGSGSMYGYANPIPAAVAQSLGIYYAERNNGIFHNHFITFSESPRLIEIKGNDIVDKVRYCMGYDECANTNIAAVFKLILSTAKKYHLPQSEMPSRLYIISDMEFDYAAENADITNFEYAKKQFKDSGYNLPQVVFWNVASRRRQVPVSKNEQGAVLVSGCSPQIFNMLQDGELNPLDFMLSVLNSERYLPIVA